MYRSKFWRVSTPAVGALGVFVWLCASGVTAEAFDTPTVNPSAAAQSVQVEPSVEPALDREGSPVEARPPAGATRTAMAGPPGCGNEYPGDCDNAQNGLRSFDTQEFPNAGMCWDGDGDTECDENEDVDEDGDCDIADCNWLGTAYPIVVEGTSIDSITVQFNANWAGGDIYLTGANVVEACGSCPWDVDSTGAVGAFDLAFLLGNWGTIPKDPNPAVVCLDAGDEPDGDIGAFDLANLLGNWGDCPPDLSCQPNVFDMRRMLGCAISGLVPGVCDNSDPCYAVDNPVTPDVNEDDCAVGTCDFVPHTLNFDSFATTPGETIWAIFVARTGNAGADALGFYDGSSRRSHSVARTDPDGPDGIPDTEDDVESQPGNSFHNQATTGNAGDWGDSHGLAELGTFACVSLSFVDHQAGNTFDCVANPEPVGGCCGLTGLVCEEKRGFECGGDGGTYLGDGSTCADCLAACNPDAGDCCEVAGHLNPGCEDSPCCNYVCGVDDFCCDEEWDDTCAQKANDTTDGCGQQGGVCQPTVCTESIVDPSIACIQSGDDYLINGTLGFALDEYGAWASGGWSGGDAASACTFLNQDLVPPEVVPFGDLFKPAGFSRKEGVFGNALFIYVPDPGGDPALDRRAICSGVPNHENTYPVDILDAPLFPEIPEAGAAVLSDTDDDGLMDTVVSQFILCEPLSDIALTFDVTQHVETVASSPGQGVGVLTQTYTIENTSGTAVDFLWIRQVDSDLLWLGDAGDDSVGTQTHAGGDVSVYTMENNRPPTAVTLSSPQGAFYYGGKGDFDPDGVGTCDAGTCTGGPHAGEACDTNNCPDIVNIDVPECVCTGGPIFGCGTDFQQWGAFGLPEAWANYIANVGHDVDGDSGGSPAGCNGDSGGCSCDGSIGVGVEVSLEPGESTCVCIQYTYGQRSPWMGGTCPEGCN